MTQFSSLLPFSFEGRSLRVLREAAGEPLFVAKDVALAGGGYLEGDFYCKPYPETDN